VRKLSKFFIPVVVVVAMIYTISQIVSGSSQNQEPETSGTTGTPAVQPTPAPNTPAPNGPTFQAHPLTKTDQAIVDAATLATTQLTSAALLPESQMALYVDQFAAPSQRSAMLAAMTQNAQSLTVRWGYTSLAQADSSAQYYIQPEKFRIDYKSARSATVSLYVLMHWVTADGQEYMMPGITVISLQHAGNRWYFYSTALPQQGQAPQIVNGTTYEQAVQLYQPFLKEGYRDYVQTSRTP
jgi:hypothetical protein